MTLPGDVYIKHCYNSECDQQWSHLGLSSGDTHQMGFNPQQRTKITRTDALILVSAALITLAAIAWTLFG